MGFKIIKMKKIFTLFSILSTAVSLMAQHGAMNFIGNGDFYLPIMKETSFTNTIKDTIVVEMTDNNTASITLPSMVYQNSMTINSFTISGAVWTMDMSTYESTWAEQSFETTTTGTDNEEKSVSGTIAASYSHSTGALQVTATFTYGSMPMAVTYENTAYYTIDNSWNLVGRGTANNPYKIYEAADFQSMADSISSTNVGTDEYFVMMNDIDFGGSETNTVQLPSIGKGFISNISSVSAGFNGFFDGQGYSISGIYHTNCENNEAGKFNALFASIDTACVIKNLTFTADNYIKSYNYTAPFVSVGDGTIQDCVNKADVTATNYAGAGFIGSFILGKGSIINCVNEGNIVAMTYAAGIVGGVQTGSKISSSSDGYDYLIDGCTNNGNIATTNGVGASGIAGIFAGTIKNSTNNGSIDDTQGTGKSRMNTAGIVGSATYISSIDQCENNGTITGIRYVGGIVANIAKGDDSNFTVTNCTNNGTVTADSIVGGIAGFNSREKGVITLSACENYGVVSATVNANLSGNLRGSENIVIGENCVIASSLSRLPLDPETISAIDEVITELNDNDVVSYDLYGRSYNGKGLQIKNGKIVLVK